MKTTIESAIKELTRKSENALAPHDAMHFAQAALSLAHVLALLDNLRT